MGPRALLLALGLGLAAACSPLPEDPDALRGRSSTPRGDLTVYWEAAPPGAQVSVRPAEGPRLVRPVFAGAASFPGLAVGPVEILVRRAPYRTRSVGYVLVDRGQETVTDLAYLFGQPAKSPSGRNTFGRWAVRPVPDPAFARSR